MAKFAHILRTSDGDLRPTTVVDVFLGKWENQVYPPVYSDETYSTQISGDPLSEGVGSPPGSFRFYAPPGHYGFNAQSGRTLIERVEDIPVGPAPDTVVLPVHQEHDTTYYTYGGSPGVRAVAVPAIGNANYKWTVQEAVFWYLSNGPPTTMTGELYLIGTGDVLRATDTFAVSTKQAKRKYTITTTNIDALTIADTDMFGFDYVRSGTEPYGVNCFVVLKRVLV